MSSGVAKKEISSNPAPNAVTAPTDPKLKKVDVERKTKLYGIIAAFREGKYPSNRQIDETLDYVLKHEPIDTAKLSPDGRMLIQDFQNIIKTSKRMVAEKNADELFQNFLWETRRVDYGKGNLKDVNLPVKKEELDKDAEQALVNLKTLAKLIFTNSEARKILKDISILGQDVAADAAAKLSDVARPDDDKLAKTDEPAPSNQWVGPNGEVRSHNDPVPDTGLAAKRAEAQAKKEEVKQKATEEANSTADRVANAADGAQQGQVTDEDRANAAANAGADQAQAEGQRLKDKLLSSIPDEHKDRAREQADKLKEYGREKFPKERRERYIYRLKKVIVENQRHRDYQEAIEFFLDRIETYAAHGKDVANQSGSKGLDVRNDPSFKKAEDNLRTLLERFANGQSMDPIFKAIDQLYTDAKNDEELRKWFKELDTYARQCLQEPGYIMRDAANTEGRRLLDSGKKFWDPKQGKYAPHKDNLFSAIETFFTAYADDALNVQLGNDVKQLTKNLLFDKEGNLQYKPHLWKDIRDVIIPTFAKQVGYIPIPRIEYTDPQVDLVIENLTLESQNIFPNIIELEARNYFKLSPYSTIKDASKHSFWLSFSQIQADLKDVAFYIKKKQGFPKLSDNGTADVFLGGQGISGKIHLESTGRPHHAFKVLDVKVKVDKFKFNVRSAKHSVLVAILRPLASGLIKKSIQKALEQAIREGLQQLDAQISDLKERYEDAKAKGDETGKLDALKQAYQDKKAEAEEAKREHTPKGQFQFTTNRDSKLINWSSPDSIVEKQGAKMDAARETGAGSWKSSAFDIVNGKSATAAPTTTATTTTAPRV